VVDAAVIYTPRPDATPEAEVNALASVYRFIMAAKPESRNNAAIVTKEEGGNSVERDGATTQPRKYATKESKK
jgi:hypothetical protein